MGKAQGERGGGFRTEALLVRVAARDPGQVRGGCVSATRGKAVEADPVVLIFPPGMAALPSAGFPEELLAGMDGLLSLFRSSHVPAPALAVAALVGVLVFAASTPVGTWQR